MFRRLGLALAISGLLVSMIPATVAAATWTLTTTVTNVDCTNRTADVTVSWTGGHGHWIRYELDTTYYVDGQVAGHAFTGQRKVDAGPGQTTLTDALTWSYSAGVISVDIQTDLLRGGHDMVIGSWDTTADLCPLLGIF